MNEETPTPFDTVGDAPVEARIVAWVLGEASAFEAAELERLCEEKPELLVFRRRMRALHGLLTEAEAGEKDHSWKLPEEKRKMLDEILGEEKVTRLEPKKNLRIRHSGRRAFLAIAACLVLTIFVAKLIVPIGRMSPIKSAVATDTAAPQSKAAAALTLQELNKAIRDQEDKVEERRKDLATIVRTKGIIYKGQDSFYGQSGVDEDVMKNDSREEAIKRGLDAQDYADAKADFESNQQLLQAMKLKQIEQTIASKVANEGGVGPGAAAPVAQAAQRDDGTYKVEAAKKGAEPIASAKQSQLAKQSAERQRNQKPAGLAANSPLADPSNPSSIDAMPPIVANGMSGGLDGSHADGARFAGMALANESTATQTAAEPEGENMSSAPTLSRSGSKNKEGKMQAPAKPRVVPPGQPTPAPAIVAKAGSGTLNIENGYAGPTSVPVDEKVQEFDGVVDYGAPIAAPIEIVREFQYPKEFEPPAPANEPPPAEEAKLLADLANEIPAAETPSSTFSLNISDASFQLAKAALAKGERPDPAGIKPEQFYNAVDYGDPAPASNEPVAATIEQAAHPVIPGRTLVRVALRTGSVGRSAMQPLRLTLLVDQSGSMVREDRRASMEHALSPLGVLLTKADLVTVIGFSRTPHLLADGMTGDHATKLADLVNQTASEGGTTLEEAMKLGGQLAQRHQLAGAQNRIVLFTDGAANLGDANPARLAELVKSFRQQGIAFDIAGIGADGLNDRLPSELARNGNGRYYVVGNEKNDSFARQLAGAFRPAAENVKVQVNFNPQRVGKYKLIGFEKDRLKTRDFRNEAVDAAELAAEEAGVAIYQVEPLADGTGEIGEVSVRFRDAATGEMVERAWTISYDSQATAFDRATPSMQLAGLSLLAAEKLKGGPLADAIDFKQLTGPTSLVKQFYASSPRVGDMLRVIDALK